MHNHCPCPFLAPNVARSCKSESSHEVSPRQAWSADFFQQQSNDFHLLRLDAPVKMDWQHGRSMLQEQLNDFRVAILFGYRRKRIRRLDSTCFTLIVV
ncbi:MAG: hypothetical protein Q4D38_14705 [Planctomycetia bacterium]|nr:hypothetical protein [Planctomycetia bacterium]